MEFDLSLFVNNLYFLLKKKEMRIGEFEISSGVSPGYLSRLRDGNTRPGIDFILKAAEQLDTKVDALLTYDFTRLSPNEEYYFRTISKIISDIQSDSVDYEVRIPEYYNDLTLYKGNTTSHPLFRWEYIYAGDEFDKKRTSIYYNSHAFGKDSSILGNSYEILLGSETIIYVIRSLVVKGEPLTEIWIHSAGLEPCFLCSDQNKNLAPLIKDLLDLLNEHSSHPKIKAHYKTILDQYLTGTLPEYVDITDEDKLPF